MRKQSAFFVDKDIPLIEKDFADMEAVLAKRVDTIKIPLKGNSPDATSAIHLFPEFESS